MTKQWHQQPKHGTAADDRAVSALILPAVLAPMLTVPLLGTREEALAYVRAQLDTKTEASEGLSWHAAPAS